MTMSKVDEEVGDPPLDSYEPIKRLAMVQIQPPRNPSKPFTSFGIKDILGPKNSPGYNKTPQRVKILEEISEDKSHISVDIKNKQANAINCCLENQIRSLKRSLCMSPDSSRSEDFGKNSTRPQRDNETNTTKRRATNRMNNFHTRTECPNSEYNFLHDSKQRESSRPEIFRDSDDEHIPSSPSLVGLCSPSMDGRRHPQGSNRQRSVSSDDFSSPKRNLDDNQKPVNLSTTKIVRPWDSDAASLSPHSTGHQASLRNIFTPTPGAILTASEASSDEEEISVDDDEPPPRRSLIVALQNSNGRSIQAVGITNVKNNTSSNKSSSNNNRKKLQSVSPLDALMAMTSKTFEGLETSGSSEAKRRDQAALFGKHQPPKKRRKSRTAFTNQQIYELEKRFLYQKYLTPADRDEIAATLGLSNAQVITWFQNRRAKLKRDLEELKNDVTAAKKFPSHKSGSNGGAGVMSLAELELRRVQEKTLRDSFNNGGLQSPSSSSIASVTSEDGPEQACTPLRSPVDVTSSSGAEDGSNLNVGVETPRKFSDDEMDISDSKLNEVDVPTDLTRRSGEHSVVEDVINKELVNKPQREIPDNFLNCRPLVEKEKCSNTFDSEHRASLMET